MKIGFIGLGNMAGTICQGLIKSDFIDGSEVYGYDINSQQLMNKILVFMYVQVNKTLLKIVIIW